VPSTTADLSLLSAMITPAVLISACGTLIFSTSTRLSRIVDRVRQLSQSFEQLYTGSVADFPDERRAEVERQLFLLAGRGRLIQRALTSFYVALGIFVGTTMGIGLAALFPRITWLPTALGASLIGAPVRETHVLRIRHELSASARGLHTLLAVGHTVVE
jgi:hypothetical protein